jgi:hypothetical protein
MGIWRTLDGGKTWEPACIGVGAAILKCVAVDPNHPGYVYVGDTDNGMWISHDHGESVAYITKPPSTSKPTINDIAVDPANSIVYAISTDGLWRYDPVRRLWSRPKGSDGKTLENATGGKVPREIGVVHTSGSSVILAVVDSSGIWRLAEGGDWMKASTGPDIKGVAPKGGKLQIVNLSGSSVAYLGDVRSGIWRSRDAGQNWTLIWSKEFGANINGSIAVTSKQNELFVATNEGVCRLDQADTGDPVGSQGNAIVVTNLGGLKGGLLAGQGNTVWGSGKASPSGTQDVVLWKCIDGKNFTSFPDEYYEGAAGFASGLAVEPGFQYTSAGHFGAIVSER